MLYMEDYSPVDALLLDQSIYENFASEVRYIIRAEQVGSISLLGGGIVVGDYGKFPSGIHLLKSMPADVATVRMAIGRKDNGDQRILFVEIRIEGAQPVTLDMWRTVDGESLGVFITSAAFLNNREMADPQGVVEMVDQRLNANQKGSCSWATIGTTAAIQMLVVDSGFGTGGKAILRGCDDSGATCSVVIDFGGVFEVY